MPANNPLSRLAAYHTALDSRDLDAVEKMLAHNCRYMSAGLGDVQGRAAIMQAMKAYFATNPDHQAFDDRLEQRDDNTAISHWRLRATNKRTGVITERHGIEVVTFDAEGLITIIEVRDGP